MEVAPRFSTNPNTVYTLKQAAQMDCYTESNKKEIPEPTYIKKEIPKVQLNAKPFKP